MKKLDCGSCTVCCQNDLIILKEGDDIRLYQTTVYNGNIVLEHKENGDCIYLDQGCTIYKNRPAVCRTLDCRKVYKKVKKNPAMAKFLSPEFITAAKQ